MIDLREDLLMHSCSKEFYAGGGETKILYRRNSPVNFFTLSQINFLFILTLLVKSSSEKSVETGIIIV